MNTPPIADLYLKTEVSIEHEGRLIPIVDSPLIDEEAAIHVITAWNPGDERPTPAQNDAANARLFDELADRGLSPIRAIGADPDSPHFEESWAIVGLSDDEARDIGAEFGQVAIFKFQGQSQAVIACIDSWVASRKF